MHLGQSQVESDNLQNQRIAATLVADANARKAVVAAMKDYRGCPGEFYIDAPDRLMLLNLSYLQVRRIVKITDQTITGRVVFEWAV